ncbi:CHAD domain-containing protein [Streptomyces sp. BI20]|uniref:CYTH and CHAD domain-containing protein n=1 Tax=Streptomyces sp. BI20 TaxID=3403460 RepID=UPI003C768E2E
MADHTTHREIEATYAFRNAKALRKGVPDLTGTSAGGPGADGNGDGAEALTIAAVDDRGTRTLDAVYWDTPDRRLAAAGITLRRRTGGADAGWHLKLPVAPGVRDELHAPLADTPPPALTALLRARVRTAPLEPLLRITTERHARLLTDAAGRALAELATDTVHAARGPHTADWTEVEVELADAVDPALLDAVTSRFAAARLHPSEAPSKLARALTETGARAPAPEPAPHTPDPDTAAAHLLAHLREQLDAITTLDPAVRRDLPDAVHRLRVATRRTRSAFKTHGALLDRARTDPLGEELKWLAGELGVDRDQEVLVDRLRTALDTVPRALLHGPVRGRLRTWHGSRRKAAHRRALAALDSPRHLALLESLHALLADPPLLPPAAKPADKALPKVVRRAHGKLLDRLDTALDLPAGPARDLALHEARKAAKRLRYAAEAARPALGAPAKQLVTRVKRLQNLLGDHQDGVVARTALLTLGRQAHAAGESSFTWGLLHARESAHAADLERALPAARADLALPPELAG